MIRGLSKASAFQRQIDGELSWSMVWALECYKPYNNPSTPPRIKNRALISSLEVEEWKKGQEKKNLVSFDISWKKTHTHNECVVGKMIEYLIWHEWWCGRGNFTSTRAAITHGCLSPKLTNLCLSRRQNERDLVSMADLF